MIPAPITTSSVVTDLATHINTLVAVRLVHNGTTYPARPDVPAGMAEYVGPSEPSDWTDGDTWTETAAA